MRDERMEPRWAESRYTGLFTRFGPVPPRPHDPAVAIWGGRLATPGSRAEAMDVGGAGWDRRAARDACLGEAIERWQSYRLPADQVIEASFAAWPLDEPAVEPSRWVLFAADQYALPGFPFRPMAPEAVGRWVCCRRAPDGDPWWAPADLVYLDARPGEVHAFGPSTSTGLCCGRLGQPVLLRGLQEVIERDALMGAWWGHYPLVESEPGRALSTLDPSIPGRLLRPNLRYRFYRVDSPYSAHATIVTLEGEDHEGYCFSAGSACRESRAASWRKSLLEAVQGRHYVRRLTAGRREPDADSLGGRDGRDEESEWTRGDRSWRPRRSGAAGFGWLGSSRPNGRRRPQARAARAPEASPLGAAAAGAASDPSHPGRHGSGMRAGADPERLLGAHGRGGDRGSTGPSPAPPASFAEHAAYYSLHPERLSETVLHRAAGQDDDQDLGADRTEDLAGLIERLGRDRPVLFRNLTPPAVAGGPLDRYVLRVVVPGLQPMHGDHCLPFLGGPLWRPRGLADWARIPPHPFP